MATALRSFDLRLERLTQGRLLDRSWRMERWAALLAAAPPGLPAGSAVKVTGTNGKGSVSAMLAASLAAAGKRVGLFTSPHLERVTERIRIDGEEIDEAGFAAHLAEVEAFLADFLHRNGARYTPSLFEVLLLVALRAFAAQGVDFAVFEAGIGGAHDPTSLLPGVLSIVTTVGLDHESELGSTRVEIAREKTGIATAGSTLVLGPAIEGEVRRAIEEQAGVRGLAVVPALRERLRVVAEGREGSVVAVWTANGEVFVRLPLLGDFQRDNLATVATAFEALAEAGAIGNAGEAGGRSGLVGVEETRWPARMEFLPGAPGWLLDGAHNEEAIDSLVHTVEKYFGPCRRVLVFGTTARKSYRRYLDRLGRLAPEIWLTDDFDDAEDRGTLAGWGEIPNVAGASGRLEELLEKLILEHRSADALIVVTGSLYLVGKVRGWLAGRRISAAAGAVPAGREA